MGRLPLVALEATLAAYLRGEPASVPAVAMTVRFSAELRERADRWAKALAQDGVDARVLDLASVTGGGTYAGEHLPSVGIAIHSGDAEALLDALRRAEAPVLARIEDGAVVCDARTVLPGEDEALLCSLKEACLDVRTRGRG
jgi:L-seryl-tRNA(Ser) seleniumtransferase